MNSILFWSSSIFRFCFRKMIAADGRNLTSTSRNSYMFLTDFLQPRSYSAKPAKVRRQSFIILWTVDLSETFASCPLNVLPVFIAEITARAFIIADSNKRRTLSRSDIAKALSKSDQFDFLIDIVPRDELSFPGATTSRKGAGSSASRRDQVR